MRRGNGGSILLGPVIAKAGEGIVYDVDKHPDLVAKIFHTAFAGVTNAAALARKTADLDEKRRKVQAMVHARPAESTQPDGHVVLAWPVDTIVGTNEVIGFLMPKIDVANSVELHQITNTSDRLHPAPSSPQWVRGMSHLYLVNTAINLCGAVQVVHGAGAVIGDFNERNVLVSNTTAVSLVDCDSMQFSVAGRLFPGIVGREEYTAPEILGKDARTHRREPSSDLFGLAIHIYMLLMDGAHPFLGGAWKGPGEVPEMPVLARQGDYAGGRKSRLGTQRTAPDPSIWPKEIVDLFERAFVAGAQRPEARPKPAEWRAALRRTFDGMKGT